jgi:hypothetical protein
MQLPEFDEKVGAVWYLPIEPHRIPEYGISFSTHEKIDQKQVMRPTVCAHRGIEHS